MMDFIFVLTKLVKIFLIGKPDVEGPFMNSKLKTGIKNGSNKLFYCSRIHTFPMFMFKGILVTILNYQYTVVG